jgi:hypothetical protein
VNPARTAGSAEPQPFEVVDGIRQVQVQLERLAADGARVVGVDIQHHLVLSLHRVLRNLSRSAAASKLPSSITAACTRR